MSNSVIIVWKKPTSTEAYKASCCFVLKEIKRLGATGLVSDIYCRGLVSVENRLWFQKEIMPEASRARLEKIAIVAPNDVFSEFYIDNLKETTLANDLDIDIGAFQDLISAQAWMLGENIPV